MLRLLQLPRSSQLDEIERLSSTLANHPLYYSVKSIADVRIYMEHQVWCVWDFMGLLKAIETNLLSNSITWVSPVDAQMGYYIYDILMSEETDINETGGERSSHFDTYLRAMSQAGANRASIDRFISALRGGTQFEKAMALAEPPSASREFVNVTMRIAHGPVHGAVATFCLSRESIIPNMFTTLLTNLGAHADLSIFEWYLRRHVAVDSESHGPTSVRLFQRVIGNDETKLAEALECARQALTARLTLLDLIRNALPSQARKVSTL